MGENRLILVLVFLLVLLSCRQAAISFNVFFFPYGNDPSQFETNDTSILCVLQFTTSRVVQKRRNDVVAQSAADEATTDVSDGIRIIETELHKEAEQSYLSYAMSVIVGRALPDARDGLKPVHRRILYAMHELGLQPGKPYRKSARVVGEVLGKFHPHGDTAVYDTLVRMAQDFSLRLPLISGHGNFGSMDDDPPAAMRYTECRLEPVAAAALLSDLESDTVDFLPNFDASTVGIIESTYLFIYVHLSLF